MIASHQCRKPWLSTQRAGLRRLDERLVNVNSAGEEMAAMEIDFTTSGNWNVIPKKSFRG